MRRTLAPRFRLPLLLLPFVTAAGFAAEPVSLSQDVRPILAEHCFPCHGPDSSQRKAGLRLDEANRAVVPGRPELSRLLARVAERDPQRRMPPPGSGRALTAGEIARLRAWIRTGAPQRPHWAYRPLAAPRVPVGTGHPHPIDAFVAARLRRHGLDLAPEASPADLLRRVTLDLTGLPPTRAEWAAFQADLARPGAHREQCYQRVVDRLLASPHFGEHLAVGWLDAARYADTNGYFGDKPRQMWLWRDWVLDAFNRNMPFDQFTVEQLAGDLLPNPTLPQRIATGFNRNHVANNETGIIDEEFRVEYVVDRVHTTMTVWQGMTAGCAQCHDHKIDPLSQREFYGLFAFFNNVPEKGLITSDNPPPLLEAPTPSQAARREAAAQEAAAAAAAFAPVRTRLAGEITGWERKAIGSLPHAPTAGLLLHEHFDEPPTAGTTRGTRLLYERGVRGRAVRLDATGHQETPVPAFDPDRSWTMGIWLHPDGQLSCPLSRIEPTGRRRGIEILLAKGIVRVHLVNEWGVRALEVVTREPLPPQQWHQLVITYNGSRQAAGLRVFLDGKPARTEVKLDALVGTLANGEPLRFGRRDEGLGFYGVLDEARLLQRTVEPEEVASWFWADRIRGILALPEASRSPAEKELLLDYYLTRFGSDADRVVRRRERASVGALTAARAAIPTALVMEELPQPRSTRVLLRGQYDRPGESVGPGVPAALAPWPAGLPRNRLGFARWLVAPENGLTARVAVNRFWQHLFGEGLVRSVEDFGNRGDAPSHPELLDWLAIAFRETGWDTKALFRRIVTSRTYRQRSEFLMRNGRPFDPENRFLGRAPGHRLSAEMLRDQALALSGLLVRTVGGPSVRPPQPPGLWEAVSYNAEESYVPDRGPGRWRRSLYTYLKRQAPPPALLTFDGPTREKCTLRRQRTNTPLQALVLLNDETYVEAARVLGARIAGQAGSDATRLRLLWQTVLLRSPRGPELAELQGLLTRQRRRFATDPGAARQLLAVGEAPTPVGDPREPAAWAVTAQTVLTLDEAITRP